MFALKISPTFKESDETIGSYAALYDLAWPRGTYCGLVWYFMALYGLFVVFLAKYWFDWTWIVFCRSHRSKFIWSCFWNLFHGGKDETFQVVVVIYANHKVHIFSSCTSWINFTMWWELTSRFVHIVHDILPTSTAKEHHVHVLLF